MRRNKLSKFPIALKTEKRKQKKRKKKERKKKPENCRKLVMFKGGIVSSTGWYLPSVLLNVNCH